MMSRYADGSSKTHDLLSKSSLQHKSRHLFYWKLRGTLIAATISKAIEKVTTSPLESFLFLVPTLCQGRTLTVKCCLNCKIRLLCFQWSKSMLLYWSRYCTMHCDGKLSWKWKLICSLDNKCQVINIKWLGTVSFALQEGVFAPCDSLAAKGSWPSCPLE